MASQSSEQACASLEKALAFKDAIPGSLQQTLPNNKGRAVMSNLIDVLFRMTEGEIADCHISYYNPVNGKLIENYDAFVEALELAVDRNDNSSYETTDHAIQAITFKGIRVVLFPRDNSDRSNKAGNPAKDRFEGEMRVLNAVIAQSDLPTFVIMTECCRPSCNGPNFEEDPETKYWVGDMIEQIEDATGMIQIGSAANNADEMSFGVTCWVTKETRRLVRHVSVEPILTEKFGSHVLIIKLKDGTTFGGVHFPLDFRGDGLENLNAKTLIGLIAAMKKYDVKFVVGDFNHVGGTNIIDAMELVLAENPDFMFATQLKDILSGYLPPVTFYGSHIDTLHPSIPQKHEAQCLLNYIASQADMENTIKDLLRMGLIKAVEVGNEDKK